MPDSSHGPDAPTRPLLDRLAGDAEVGPLFDDRAELSAMLRVEGALAAAQAEVSLVTPEGAKRIAEACRTFRPDWDDLAHGMERDGLVVPSLIRQLRAAVGPAHAKALHRGATSQDIIDTGLVLRLAEALPILERRLGAIIGQLGTLRVRDGATPLMAHTRMQAALPFTADDKIETWVHPLERDQTRIAQIKPRLLVVQLGGPVGTRAELGGQGEAVAAALASRLGLGAAPAWHSQRDAIAEFAGWLSLLTGTLGKIGQDVALMAQSEVGTVQLAEGGGSSAMPHKSNPVRAELLVALARLNAGHLGTLHQALVHEGERSGTAWTLEWLVLPSMVLASAAALRHAKALLDTLTFRETAAPA